jgi:hypothetical protein
MLREQTMIRRFAFLHVRQKASALVTTLFVIVVLSTIVLAFLQSMSLERKISQSIKHKYQAELIADAGLQEALVRIYETKHSGPYAAVYLPTNNNPYLFLAKREFLTSATLTRRIPLFSTRETNFIVFTNLAATFLSSGPLSMSDRDRFGAVVTRQLSASNDIFCDINATNSSFPYGQVGLRSAMGTSSHPNLPVNWIYMTNSGGKVIGRYAYWCDDECSKLDLRFAGNAQNPTGNHFRSNGNDFSELSLLTLTNIPNVATTPTAGALANLMAFKNSETASLPISPKHLIYSLSNGITGLSSNEWEAIRPYVTIYSRHDDRSLDGKRRINLNELVSSTISAEEIARQTLSIRSAITNNLPVFGERFYSASNGTATTPTPLHQKAYVTRIAANIRDFIDSDTASTVIMPDDTAYIGITPEFTPYDPAVLQDGDLPLAFGKDAPGVYLSEYLRVARVISPNPHPSAGATPVTVRVRFGHYIELINMSGRTITYQDLGEDPHLVLGGRGDWMNVFAGGFPERLRLSDIKIRLPQNVSIPPGGFFYITTDAMDPSESPGISTSQLDILGNKQNWHQASAGTNYGQWELINTNGNTSPVNPDFEDYELLTVATNRSGRGHYAVYDSPDAANPSYSAQRERLILANANGIIDCAFKLYTTRRQYLARNEFNPAWAGTFMGDAESSTSNNAPSGDTSARYSRGDPRGNFDLISVLSANTGLSWRDGNSGDYADTINSGYATIGTTNYNTRQNYTGVQLWRKGWYEYTADPAGNTLALNSRLQSLGQLGFVYDPVRHDIASYRSQGATLRIGQSDSSTNNRATNANVNYQNWLGGRGNDSATNAAYGKNAFLLMDLFQTDTNTSGRINPNSVVRDGAGVVLRAALTNFVYESEATNGASSLLASQTLNVTNTIDAIRGYATNTQNGLIVSVGDLSRIPALWSTNNAATSIVPSHRMSDASDAGKEEFLRRTANLLTTQSLAYTVYVVAQAGEIQTRNGSDTFVPVSTVTTESVIQLEPVYPESSGDTENAVAPEKWKTLKPRFISR